MVSVNGDARIDPRAAPARGGPSRVTVVFRRPLPHNRAALVSVRFTRQSI